MHLQRKGLLKHLLNKYPNFVPLFGALLCSMHLFSCLLLWLGESTSGSDPGLTGLSAIHKPVSIK
jgi:hypothetical protein